MSDLLVRRSSLAILLIALTVTASAPAECGAQRVDHAATGARYVSARVVVSPANGFDADTARADSTRRRSIRPFLLFGAVAGAVVGAVLAAGFHDSFCGEPAPGYSCSTTSPAAGAAMGAGLGLIAGGFLWVITRSTLHERPSP